MRIRMHATSPGGRVFAAVFLLICLVIGVGVIAMSVEAVATGDTTLRLRRGGRIHLSGAWAYAYALNGLLFGAACLSVASGLTVAALGPQRWGAKGFALLRAGGVLLMTAAVGATVMGIGLLIRSF
jgi:hypothetical protein